MNAWFCNVKICSLSFNGFSTFWYSANNKISSSDIASESAVALASDVRMWKFDVAINHSANHENLWDSQSLWVLENPFLPRVSNSRCSCMHPSKGVKIGLRPLGDVRSTGSSHIFAALEVDSALQDNNTLALASPGSNLGSILQSSEVNSWPESTLSACVEARGWDWRQRGASRPMIKVDAAWTDHSKVIRVLVLADTAIVLSVSFITPLNSARHFCFS